MNRYALNDQEQFIFDGCSDLIKNLPTASQYKVLRNLAHFMDREVVKPGAVRAAAAVAGSNARTRTEGANEKKASSRKKSSSKGFNYPKVFLEHGGQALLDRQQELKALVNTSPTDENRSNLRTASGALRHAFRVFKEDTESADSS